jgi:hypothetical protein
MTDNTAAKGELNFNREQEEENDDDDDDDDD